MNVLKMLPAPTLKEVTSVPVTLASLEMDSTAQVSYVCTFQMHVCKCFMFIFLDIDECSSDDYPCHINAHCTDTVGSYICDCAEGYTGNGSMCHGLFSSECD